MRFTRQDWKELIVRPAALLIAGRALQLLNSVLLSVVLVHRFGLSMVGTYAIGYVAVAFVPHFLSLGLNSHLPRIRQGLAELVYISGAVLCITLAPVILCLYVYSRLFSASPAEAGTVFLVTLTGCLTGAFNVALTLNIMSQKFVGASIAPLFEAVILLGGAISASSGHNLAWYVLAGKTISVLVIWPRVRPHKVPIKDVVAVMKHGTRYLALDALGTLNEQIPTSILSLSLTRADLGLYRLCQQTLTAAETPGWSYVQSHYPGLTTNDFDNARRVLKKMIILGSVGAGLYLAGAVPLAFWVFKIPTLFPLMAILSPALLFRYITHFGDQRLRASGRVGWALGLSTLRLALTAILTLGLVHRFGVWAAVCITTTISFSFSFLYKHVIDMQTIQGRIVPGQASPRACELERA